MSQPNKPEERGGSSEDMELLADEPCGETLIRPSIGAAMSRGEPTWQFLKQGYDWTGGSLRTKGYRTDFNSVRLPEAPARAPSRLASMRPTDNHLDWRDPEHLGVVAEFVSSLPPPAPPTTTAVLQLPISKPTKPSARTWRRRLLGWGLAAGGVLALMSLSPHVSDNSDHQSVPAVALTPASAAVEPDPNLLASSDSTALSSSSSSEGTDSAPTLIETALTPEPAEAAVASWNQASLPPRSAANSRIELEASEIMVSARAVAAVIILKRTGSTLGPARVRWKTVPGSATPGTDYESAAGTVKFADGQAVRTLFVPILQTPSRTEPRSFAIKLQRLSKSAALGPIKTTTVTIAAES